MQFNEQLKDGVGSPELVDESLQVEAPSPADQTTTTHSELAAGTVIAGTYKIVSSLGSGGMSHVYKCEDITLNRRVAVKVMHAESTRNAQSLLRFQQEGKAIALLKHPNIVEVLTLQSTPEGDPYLVMEIVEGRPLSDIIEAEGALSIGRASKIVNQVCDAVEHAHSHGVVHRDLKPSNIMIINPGTAHESVKLLDFGIAKILAPSPIKATQTGEVFGSPGYMSPEQVLGKSISEKSDQYSLGCVIFEMLTGKMPFIADSSFAVMMSHVQDEAPSLAETANREFPDQVERTVAKMMAKDPGQRFATISDAAKGFAGQSKVEAVKAKTSRTLPSPFFVWMCMLLSLMAIVNLLLDSRFWKLFERTQAPQVVSHYMTNWAAVPAYHLTPKEKDNFPQFVADHKQQQQIVVAQNYPNVTNKELAHAFEQGNPNLLRLSLQYCDTTDDGLKTLQNLPNLQELNLGETDITSGCFEHLSKLHSLKKLRLFWDHLTDDSMTELSKIKSLEDIDLEGNLDLSPAGISKLLNMPHLRNVEVGNTKVEKKDCLEFKRQYIEKHRLNAKDFHMTCGPVHPENTIREDDHDVIRAVNDDSNRI